MHHCLFLLRFKAELANVLESFVEKEDEFIKQVMQSHSLSLFFLNELNININV